MWASLTLQRELNKLHNEFIQSWYNEPLEFLRNKWIEIKWQMRKYVKIWRENRQKLNHLRKPI